MNQTFEEWQIEFPNKEFAAGMRVASLQSQPAPWVVEGLKILERGEELTVATLDGINRSGGTDHPDPWFG